MADTQESSISRTDTYASLPRDETPGHIVDFAERRAAFDAKKELTPQDLMAALKVERKELDRVSKLASDLERDAEKASKEQEIWRAGLARTTKKTNDIYATTFLKVKVLGVVALVLGVFALGMTLSSSSDVATAKSEAASAKAGLVDFKKEVAKTNKSFVTKTEMEEVRAQIKVIGLKADRSVVDRMGEELKTVNNEQDGRIKDIATAIMGKADTADLKNVRSAVNQVRSTNKKMGTKMTKLEEQIQELKIQLQAVQPKTM